jgi:hypothetical protein
VSCRRCGSELIQSLGVGLWFSPDDASRQAAPDLLTSFVLSAQTKKQSFEFVITSSYSRDCVQHAALRRVVHAFFNLPLSDIQWRWRALKSIPDGQTANKHVDRLQRDTQAFEKTGSTKKSAKKKT